MNILLINQYAGSPKYGMEFRHYYLACEWLKAGHKVRILAGTYSHIRAIQPDFFPESSSKEEINGVDYFWFKTPKYKGNGLGRIVSIISFIWKLWFSSKEIASDFSPDVVIASSTYPMDIWPAHRISKKTGAKLVYEVHDLWPLSPMELGNMSRWHPFIMLVQFAEDYAYRHANKIISMLPKAKSYMQSRGMDADKFFYVPNGVDELEWSDPIQLPSEVLYKLDEMKDVGLPIVAYTGSHGLSNALDVLLDAAHKLKGIAQVLLVGTGHERERLLLRVRQESLTNVVMLPSIPKKSIPILLSRVDIAYIGWNKNPLYRFGISPNKLMDYMMAGKPIIHSVNAGNDPVAEAGCGITVPPLDDSAVVSAILKLLQLSKEDINLMGEAGRIFILKNQTYSVLARKFLDSLG